MSQSLKNMRIIFMGTPDFAKTILETLYSEKINIVGVFAQPDRPAGRGQKLTSPPVALFAKEKNIPIFQPEKIKHASVLEQITELNPDFILVAAYGKILPESILQAPKNESLNVHASLLPKYRGAAPINYSLLSGDKTTGISIMRMVKEMDAGPVFLTRELPITDEDNAITLTDKLAKSGGKALIEVLEMILSKKPEPIEQNHDQATYAPKISREDSEIDWNQPANTIFNKTRALLPWPVATTKLSNQVLKIYKSKVLSSPSKATPGTLIHIGKDGWTVSTKDCDLLVNEVQLQGKKAMSAFDLANGLRLKANETILGT